MPQLSYRDVLEQWDRARAFGETRSLPEYSSAMNDLFGTDAYSAGLRDGWWTRASTRADQLIQGSPVGELFGGVGATVGSVFGHEEAGRQVGLQLPRALLQSAPAYLAGPEAGLPATAAALGGTAALFGAETYADTGSAKQAVLSGVTAGAMPVIGKFGGNLGARALGGVFRDVEIPNIFGPLEEGATRGTSRITGYLAKTEADSAKVNLGRFFGAQAAQAATNIASTVAQNRMAGGDMSVVDAATSPEFLLGQLPWTVYDALHMTLTPRAPTAEQLDAIGTTPKSKQPVPKKEVEPPVAKVNPTDAELASIQAYILQASTIALDKDTSPEQKSKALAYLTKFINDPNANKAQKEQEGQTAQKDLKTPVNLVGRTDKLSNGNYRVLVDAHDSQDRMQDLVGKTVFINGAEPEYDPQTRRMFFSVTPDQIRMSKVPLGPHDFVTQGRSSWEPSPTEPELPVQEPAKPIPVEQIEGQYSKLKALAGQIQDIRMQKYPLALRSPDIITFPHMGMTQEEATSLVRQAQPNTEITSDIKTAVAKHEQAEFDEANAKDKLVKNPTTSAEIPPLMDNPNGAKPILDAKMKESATATQAVSEVVQQDNTPKVDKAKMEQKRQRGKLRELAKIDQAKKVEAGNKLINDFTSLAVRNPDSDHPDVEIGKYLRNLLGKITEMKDPKIFERLAATVQKWSEGFYGERDLDTLRRVIGGTKARATKTPSKTVLSLKDENGNRYAFGTELEARAFLQIHPEHQEAGWDVERSDASRKKRFFIGKRPPPPETSLDKKVSEEGETTIGDLIPQDATDVPVDNRPKASKVDALGLAQDFFQNPVDFADDVPNPKRLAPKDHQLAVKQKLGQYVEAMKLLAKGEVGRDTESFVDELNDVLVEKGFDPFETKEDLSDMLDTVDYWLKNYTSENRSLTMDSTVPGGDVELGKSLGIHGTVQDMAAAIGRGNWGIASVVMRAIELSGILPKDVNVIGPGHPNLSPNEFFMRPGLGIKAPDLNIPYYPTAERIGDFVKNLAHELVHVSEDALARRTDEGAIQYRQVRRDVLKALRNTSAVPNRVRQVLKEILANDDITKIREGTYEQARAISRKWRTMLGKYYDDYHFYVYAMQNPEEMAAVLFSDPRMVYIADKTSMGKKGVVDSALAFLSKAFNILGLGGKGEDTALSTMLKSYDNYLTSGLLKKTYSGSQFIRDALVEQGVMPEAMASRMVSIDRMYNRGTLEASIAGFKREMDAGLLHPMQTKGTLDPVLETALRIGSTDEVYKGTMNLTAENVPVHQELYRRLVNDHNIVKQIVEGVRSGQIPGSTPPDIDTALTLSRAKINAIGKALNKQGLAIARLNKLNQLDPDVWEQSIGEGLTGVRRQLEPADEVPDAAETRKLVGHERLEGGGMNPVAKTFMLTPHVKEMYPVSKPVFQAVKDEQGNFHQRLFALFSAMIYDPKTGGVNPEKAKVISRVAGNKNLLEAVSDIFRYQNRENNMQLVDAKAPFVRKILASFNANDQRAIIQVLESQSARHATYSNVTLPEVMGNINIDNTAILIASHEKGVLPDQARMVAENVYRALDQLTNPDTAVLGSGLLQKLATQVSPETYFLMLQHAKQTADYTARWIQSVKNRPGFVTEQRYGTDNAVMMHPNGDRARLTGPRDSVQRQVSEYQRRGYELLDYIKSGDKKTFGIGMKDDYLQALDQLDSRNEQIVTELLKNQPDLLDQIIPRIRRAGDIRTQITSASPLPSVPRSFASGREAINMLDNANQFYVRMNNYFKNRAVRTRSALLMMHPEIQGNTELTNFLNTHVDSFLTPDNPLATKITKALYFYKLAFDFGQAILWGTQNMTTGMASLIGETGTVSDAFGYWGTAMKEYGKFLVTRKWENPELRALIERAGQRGELGGMASWSDFVDETANAMYDMHAGPLAKAFSPVKNAAKSLTEFSSRLNDIVGLIAAFKLARERKMDFEEAYQFASDVKSRGHFSGGKAQRAVGLFSLKTRAVPQLLGALQTYSLGWFGQMAEQYQKGFGKPPAGLNETQRTGAKKAFLYSLGAQAALAGVLGLPGVGQGIALLNQTTGVDLKGWLRQNLAGLFDEDQTYGGVMTSLALRGIGSAALPFDPSSRASISVPFLGVDSYKGFSTANLGGSVFSTADDFVKGLSALLHGDIQGFSSLVPNAAQRPLNLLLGGGDIRDRRGALMLELSPAERFAMALGLTPSRVQTHRDVAEAVKKAELNAVKQKESFVDELAQQVRVGEVNQVRTKIRDYIGQHDETAKSIVESVASRVESQTFQFDPRNALPPGVNLGGLTSGTPTQQLERARSRAHTESSLGISSRHSPSFDARLMFEDQAMTADPTLSKRSAGQQFRSSGRLPVPSLPSPYTWLSNSANQSVFQGGF